MRRWEQRVTAAARDSPCSRAKFSFSSRRTAAGLASRVQQTPSTVNSHHNTQKQRRLERARTVGVFQPQLSAAKGAAMVDTTLKPNQDDVGSLTSRSSPFASVARMLSTSQGRGAGELQRDQEFTPMTLQELLITCPSLSLHHDKGQQCNVSHSNIVNRKQAEDRAIGLLARPVERGGVHGTGKKTEVRVSLTAGSLLQNVYSSFAILVDSRLRAYSDVLARHALKLRSKKRKNAATSVLHSRAVQALSEKLDMMLAIATQVEAHAIVTELALEDGDLPTEADSVALSLNVSIDLQIPGRAEPFLVKMSTPGKMTANRSLESQKLEGVSVEVDTRHFLNNMIQQAAQVVSAIVELASHGCSSVARTLSRSISAAEMPPPMSCTATKHVLPLSFGSFVDTKGSNTFGLELLCNAAAELPIVSPVLTGSRTPGVMPVDFDLTSDEDVVSNLSIVQCEDIVDTCLFGGDSDTVAGFPAKRTRIEG